MGNADKSKLIRIYGVTLANLGGRTRSYGHGRTEFEAGCLVDYVDYFIDDLIALIKQQKLEKKFIKSLK